jgi:hypothetical protein
LKRARPFGVVEAVCALIAIDGGVGEAVARSSSVAGSAKQSATVAAPAACVFYVLRRVAPVLGWRK